MPETLRLPTDQQPEIPPDTELLNIDPLHSPWSQLLVECGGPAGLVGVEWHDQKGNLRRISSYGVFSRKQYEANKTRLPRVKFRSGVQGGMAIERNDVYLESRKEYEIWTVDIIDPEGNVIDVLSYNGYNYQEPAVEKDLVELRRSHRLDLMRQRQTIHKNELRQYLNEKAGFDEDGRPQRYLTKLIYGFRKRDLPAAADRSNLAHVPVAVNGPRVSLENIDNQRLRLGLPSWEGLAWTDEDGNRRQVVRQILTHPGPRGPSLPKAANLPEKRCLVKTSRPIVDKNGHLQYDEVTGEPMYEDTFQHFYSDEDLQTHFDARTKPPHSPALLDLHWDIPQIEAGHPDDSHLISEEVAGLWREGRLPGLARLPAEHRLWKKHERRQTEKELTDWLAQRALLGVAFVEPDPLEHPSFEEALILLNMSEKELEPESSDQLDAKIEALRNNEEARGLAQCLLELSDHYSLAGMVEVAEGLVGNARRALQILDLELGQEHNDISRVLSDLVASRYYAEHPDVIKRDGSHLTLGDAFANTVRGRQIQRDAVDRLVGESFVDIALQRTAGEGIVSRPVIDPATGKEWQVRDRGVVQEVAMVPDVIRSLPKIPESREILELLNAAVDMKGDLSSANYARIGRLLNRIAGN